MRDLKQMIVGKSMTVAAAEELLSEIAQKSSHRTQIPTHGRHHQAGGEPAIVQALVTWAQALDKPELQTYIPNALDTGDQIGSITRQFFGLSAALLCDNAMAVDGASVFAGLRAAALQRLEVLQSEKLREASRGRQFEILCVDHLNKAAPRLLYDRDPEGQPTLKNPESFIFVASKIRAAVGPLDQPRASTERFDNALGSTLYELFRNTEDHARVDDAGNKLTRSLRGVQARRHSIAPAKLVELVSASQPLAEFCARLRPPRAGNQQVQFIEISVLDSGPGYAAAIRQKPLASLSLEDEACAVRSCFLKHATGKDRSSSGLGLCNVIDILRERGGFLRLRTGRQSLYADLGLEREATYGTLPDLHDWQKVAGETPRVSGSLMTILLPIVLD